MDLVVENSRKNIHCKQKYPTEEHLRKLILKENFSLQLSQTFPGLGSAQLSFKN